MYVNEPCQMGAGVRWTGEGCELIKPGLFGGGDRNCQMSYRRQISGMALWHGDGAYSFKSIFVVFERFRDSRFVVVSQMQVFNSLNSSIIHVHLCVCIHNTASPTFQVTCKLEVITREELSLHRPLGQMRRKHPAYCLKGSEVGFMGASQGLVTRLSSGTFCFSDSLSGWCSAFLPGVWAEWPGLPGSILSWVLGALGQTGWLPLGSAGCCRMALVSVSLPMECHRRECELWGWCPAPATCSASSM